MKVRMILMFVIILTIVIEKSVKLSEAKLLLIKTLAILVR